MTSCQRPKGCEPSRYRHGNDPPKQIQTASRTNSCRAFFPTSTNPHSIRSGTSKAKELNRASRNYGWPHQEGGLFYVNVYDHWRSSMCRDRGNGNPNHMESLPKIFPNHSCILAPALRRCFAARVLYAGSHLSAS
jgi:hypothetical protein